MLGAMLYFAYGSNLGASALRTRCPAARQVGIAYVDGYRIGFTRRSTHRGGGVADLVPCPGGRVWGALFDVSDDGFDALDAYEGVPTAYAREVWDCTTPQGARVPAHVYVVVHKEAEVPPSRRYWRIIVEGAREAGLPAAYVTALERIPYLEGR
jgi:cation transport regulator ChaC